MSVNVKVRRRSRRHARTQSVGSSVTNGVSNVNSATHPRGKSIDNGSRIFSSASRNSTKTSLHESVGSSYMTSPIGYIEEKDPRPPRRSMTHARDSTTMSNVSTASREDSNLPGGNPADILLGRLLAFKDVIKSLQQHFTEFAAIEAGISKSLLKAATSVMAPFKD
ncbi:hypothetical protein BGZ83_007623, partial [Gryganskiella cystojenkinii]